jgi:hypothetical protein
MNDFDRAIMHLDKAFGFVAAPHQYISKKDEGDKLIVVEVRPSHRLRSPSLVCLQQR